MVDRRAASKARIAAGLRTFNVLADVVGLTELLIHAGHLVENNLHDPAHEELEGRSPRSRAADRGSQARARERRRRRVAPQLGESCHHRGN